MVSLVSGIANDKMSLFERRPLPANAENDTFVSGASNRRSSLSYCRKSAGEIAQWSWPGDNEESLQWLSQCRERRGNGEDARRMGSAGWGNGGRWRTSHRRRIQRDCRLSRHSVSEGTQDQRQQGVCQ